MSEYILFATLKKQWFDMIASGTKLEEYREVKPYWTTRLFYPNGMKRPYDAVVFRNGYSAAAPTMKFKYKGFRIGKGNPEWGGTDEDVYALDLSERIS